MKKNVLITGASGNLGKAAVDTFLKAGFRVLATVSPGKTLEYEVGGDMITYEVDLTNETAVNNLIAEIMRTYQSIEVALLLVGGFAAGNLESANGDQLHKMYTLNFETTYFAARAVFKNMKELQGGQIVMIGARPALVASQGKNLMAYTLSKSLIFKLAELLNEEGKAHNITTSVIVPSTIDTPVNRKAMPSADFSSWVAPETITEIIKFITTSTNNAMRENIIKVYGNS